MDQVSARVDGTKRHVLLKKALELAHGDGPIDDEAFAEAMRAMDAIMPRKDHSVSSFHEHQDRAWGMRSPCQLLARLGLSEQGARVTPH